MRVRFAKLISGDHFAESILGNSSLVSVVTNSDGFIIISQGKEVIEKGGEVMYIFLKGYTHLNNNH